MLTRVRGLPVCWVRRNADDLLDENRAKVVQAGTITTVMGFLSNPDLLPYAVAVIYNLMVDYSKEHGLLLGHAVGC